MKSLTLPFSLMLCLFSVALVLAHSNIRQKRAWIIDSFSIEEEYPGPFPYPLGRVELDRKYMVNFGLHGSGVDKEPKGVLEIDKNSGIIKVYKKVDYELYKLLMLTFEATNVSNNKVDTRLGVEIKILDINDHAPIFNQPSYPAAVAESTPQGKELIVVMATDEDDSQTPNGTFSFRIASVTPKTDNAEFFLEQGENTNTGTIYFRGCLDYEKAQKYTILVEAKDHGEKVQLSSTSTAILNVVDKNNHLPVITSHTGPGKVKERQSNVEVLHLQVTDQDSPGTDAWRAKYTIHGDKEKFFKIETDPKTNEGILTILKPMDYEEQTSTTISISVENVAPYFSCEVTGRPTKRLWDVKTTNVKSGTGLPNSSKLYPVTIDVEDVNDPPEFVPPIRKEWIMENSKAGTPLCTLKAKDPDTRFASMFQFQKGKDVDNWITVDSKTGKVFTAKVLDRESQFVKNDSSYSVVLYVVDNGEPPMTGTGTLIIQVGDQNDNQPELVISKLEMCESDEATMTNITAVDLDLPPFSGPFTYELLGDVKGKWRIEPTHGTTVSLVKENTVYSGYYELQVKVSDNQGFGSTKNLTITVCDCSDTHNCLQRRSSSAQVGSSAMGIMILASFILLGNKSLVNNVKEENVPTVADYLKSSLSTKAVLEEIMSQHPLEQDLKNTALQDAVAILLMAFLISCKQEKMMIATDEGPAWRLLDSNIETPGTDCKVPATTTQVNSVAAVKASTNPEANNGVSNHIIQQQQLSTFQENTFQKEQMLRRSLRRSSTRRSYRSYQTAMESRSRNYSTYNTDDFLLRQGLFTQINKKLMQLQAPGEELGDYNPHCYTYEGEPMTDHDLDAISIAENDFHQDVLTNLGQRFNKLGTICRPDLMS